MEWTDEGFVLSSRRHGESAAIVTLLTKSHGRHGGLVRGGGGKRAAGLYQAGNLLTATWKARLEEHLGSYTCEAKKSYAASIMDDPKRLACLSALCAMAEAVLPEREPHTAVFEGMTVILEALNGEEDDWPELYVRWELGLLAELGFGLDLSACAATGDNDGLVYVSPKSGRAVSAVAGEPYRDKLLALPGFLLGEGLADKEAVGQGLALTGHFLERHVFVPHEQQIPAARYRLVDRLRL